MRDDRADRHALLEAQRSAAPRSADHVGAISAVRRHDNQLWLSGQVAMRDGALVAAGRVGVEVDLETARRCAHQCALNLLDVAADALGGLNSVDSALRLTVYVASDPAFTQQHVVAHAATDVFTAVLGGATHVRTAFGVAALPLNSPVEVDAVLLLKG